MGRRRDGREFSYREPRGTLAGHCARRRPGPRKLAPSSISAPRLHPWPFTRLKPYSVLPFRTPPVLSISGSAAEADSSSAEHNLYQTAGWTARRAESEESGVDLCTVQHSEEIGATVCETIFASKATVAEESGTEQELLPLAHSLYQSLAAAAADPGAVRSGLEEASGKEFLSFLRRSGRQRAVWGDSGGLWLSSGTSSTQLERGETGSRHGEESEPRGSRLWGCGFHQKKRYPVRSFEPTVVRRLFPFETR